MGKEVYVAGGRQMARAETRSASGIRGLGVEKADNGKVPIVLLVDVAGGWEILFNSKLQQLRYDSIDKRPASFFVSAILFSCIATIHTAMGLVCACTGNLRIAVW